MLSLLEQRFLTCRQVAQYGLPAAGIICLALLNWPAHATQALSRARLVQDLSVLVAQIQTGALIKPGEPNFALFTRATQTIQSILDSLMSWRVPPNSVLPNNSLAQTIEHADFGTFDPWEFEEGFWANLAEHPTLLGYENPEDR